MANTFTRGRGIGVRHLAGALAMAAVIALMHRGASAQTTPAPVWFAEGNQQGAGFGYGVAPGDYNGDGYIDLAVGAHTYDNVQMDEGRAFCYHGSASGLAAAPAWSAESNLTNAFFGCLPDRRGDINGDGYDDLIVGAPGADSPWRGRIYAYHGSVAGLRPVAAATVAGWQDNMRLGTMVNIMDINGDGYSDVYTSAEYFSNGLIDEGAAFVYHGSVNGLAPAYSWRRETDQNNGRGWKGGPAGDVNGDGYQDLIWGSSYYANGQTQEGKCWLHYGSAAGLSAAPAWAVEGNANYSNISSFGGADYNNDGFSDIVVTYAASGFWGFAGSASGPGVSPAWPRVLDGAFGSGSPGDFNGDGYADLAVNAPWRGLNSGGAVYVYFGGSGGLSDAPDATFESGQGGATFGWFLPVLADVTGDGLDDIIIGACAYNNGQTDEGAVFVFAGQSWEPTQSPSPTPTPSVTTTPAPSPSPTPSPVPATDGMAALALTAALSLALAFCARQR